MNEETKKSLLNFFSKYPVKKYKKGEIILHPGEDFGGISFVKSGSIRVYSLSKDGRETSIQLFKPMFYLSLIAQMTHTKNQYFMEAISHVDVMTAPKADFLKYLENNPTVKNEVMVAFLKKFLDLTTNMLQIIASDAQSKVLGLIYSLADEFGVKKGEKVVIKFKITHKLIASLTGLTRETVTLQMLKLQKMGLIGNEKREIVVLNMKKIVKGLGY